MGLADDLRGLVCACEFDLPSTQWPIPGFPAWVVVLDADMGMVKMRSRWGGDPFWISASKIISLRATDLSE